MIICSLHRQFLHAQPYLYSVSWNARTKKAKNHIKLVGKSARPSKELRVYEFLGSEKVMKRLNLQLNKA